MNKKRNTIYAIPLDFARGRRTTIMTMLSIFVLFISVGPLYAAVGGDEKQENTAGEETVWSKDLDKKIDTTIKILQVIKEEVKDIQPAEKAAPKGGVKAPAAGEKGWSENYAKITAKMVRIWRKVRKITGGAAGGVPATEQEKAELTRDISDKLGKTIQAMQAIKKELDKIDKEDQARQE
ncbi:MAG: hypothetical protein U9R44_03530 [Candidatus Omnitrophota bacterium]|nr:hypothetical protein [Candidatus Omnitrophota bacterium]